ncbi:hypothetical protein [Amycolatopsis kentuckyensis]|uniref:hypothetical protein n=1 Tax=Amycolatopsis kentuckyensis TaxID=218823 RepID=UPI003568EA21
MSTTDERHAPGHHDRPPVRIAVTVNDDQVILSEHRLSGAQIKAKAVDQGADLQVGFQLSVKRGHRFHVVDDEGPAIAGPNPGRHQLRRCPSGQQPVERPPADNHANLRLATRLHRQDRPSGDHLRRERPRLGDRGVRAGLPRRDHRRRPGGGRRRGGPSLATLFRLDSSALACDNERSGQNWNRVTRADRFYPTTDSAGARRATSKGSVGRRH